MLTFRLFGFQVIIQAWFLITSAILGGALRANSPEAWRNVGLWVLASFISILLHEIGHGVFSRRYGGDPFLVLTGMGGLCVTPNARFSRSEHAYVIMGGPMVSVLLGIVSKLALENFDHGPVGFVFFTMMVHINIFWTIMNVLPVLPLDGGQLFANVMGPGNRQLVQIVGGVTAVAAAAYLFSENSLFGAILFAVLAFENFTGRDSMIFKV